MPNLTKIPVAGARVDTEANFELKKRELNAGELVVTSDTHKLVAMYDDNGNGVQVANLDDVQDATAAAIDELIESDGTSVTGITVGESVQQYDYEHLDHKLDKTAIAPLFDSSQSYAVGDCVIHDGQLYKCRTAGSGAWDDSRWTLSSVVDVAASADALDEAVTELKGDLNYSKTVTPGYVLSATNNGHGSQWVPYSGAPTDEQVAEAVSDWLDEHPEATTTVEDGSITEAKLSSDVLDLISNAGSIINVNAYGAKGNGVADDTAAIQQCITENPHALIYFPKGCYNISAPIDCYHHTFGTYLLLGGAMIKATAQMPYMFYFHNKTKPSGVGGYGFGAHGTFGGVINANGLAQECIRAEDDWMLKLNSTYCINFTLCGIDAVGGGLHNYSNIKCDIESTYPWSEGVTTGIIAEQVDSFFTDVQIMSCRYAVKIGGGGHIFSGCYFLSRVNYHLDANVHWQGIGIYIENEDVAPLVTFNNCYFDSHIYAFWSESSKVWDLDVNDCRFYYTHGTQFDATQAYILGGNNINIRAKGVAIFSRPGCDTLLGRMSYSPTDNKNFVFEQNKPLDTYIGSVLNVANMGGGLISFGSGVRQGDLFYIGAISNANFKGGTYKMSIAYGDNYTELIFKNDGTTNKFTLVEANRHFKAAFFSVFIDQSPKTATDTIETVTYYPIYLFSNVNNLQGNIIITLEPLSFKPASCYIFNDGYRQPSGAVTDPFIMQAGYANKAVYFIGDSITAGTGATTLYHQLLKEMATLDGYSVNCYNWGVGSTGFYCYPVNGNTVDMGNGVEGDGTLTEVTEILRIDKIIDNKLPSTVPYAVLFAGTNDYAASAPLVDSDKASGEVVSFTYMFNSAMQKLAAKTNNILVVTPIRRENGETVNSKNRKLSEYCNVIKEISSQYGALVYDGYDIMFNPDKSNNKTAFMPDGLHPNNAGHQKIAACLYEKFKALIA